MHIAILQWHLLHGFLRNFNCIIMKDYRRLKQDENSRFSLDWNLNRALSKVNYRIHTDAVKESILKIMESIRQPDRMIKIRYLMLLLSEGLYRIRFIVAKSLMEEDGQKRFMVQEMSIGRLRKTITCQQMVCTKLLYQKKYGSRRRLRWRHRLKSMKRSIVTREKRFIYYQEF